VWAVDREHVRAKERDQPDVVEQDTLPREGLREDVPYVTLDAARVVEDHSEAPVTREGNRGHIGPVVGLPAGEVEDVADRVACLVEGRREMRVQVPEVDVVERPAGRRPL